TPVKVSAPSCAKAQPPAKREEQTAIASHHSETPKCKDVSLRRRTFERESDFRRIRPPNFLPRPCFGSVRSILRKISSISRSYLFGIVVLFLELASTTL